MQSLPPEIAGKIFEDLTPDSEFKSALPALALTCRAFLPEARRALYHSVTLDTIRHPALHVAELFLRTLHSTPALRPQVHTLAVTIDAHRGRRLGATVAHVLTLCDALYALDVDVMRYDDVAERDALHAAIAVRTGLRHLRLATKPVFGKHRCSAAQSFALLAALPHLESVQLRTHGWHLDESAPEAGQVSACPRLRRISVDAPLPSAWIPALTRLAPALADLDSRSDGLAALQPAMLQLALARWAGTLTVLRLECADAAVVQSILSSLHAVRELRAHASVVAPADFAEYASLRCLERLEYGGDEEQLVALGRVLGQGSLPCLRSVALLRGGQIISRVVAVLNWECRRRGVTFTIAK
ncbi:hypothetical protein FA95DRAFT_339494 [Auriscalpium vulgare]|uniref:Uncharacterized protein n=1 Tax=Auriscalpium vulgare TaxID=40419 RepID=A0ACB8RJF0_9AGAM|nr:hypothetical protein FA95DRAFT_339494 [Auriscalpium vulgare]